MAAKPWFSASCAPNPADPWESLAAGFVSGVASVLTLFPIQKVMFEQQVKGVSTPKSFNTYIKAGSQYFYKGLLPPVLQKGLQHSVMFSFNKFVEQRLNLEGDGNEQLVLRSLSGVGSGSMEWLMLTPTERVQSLLMDQDRNRDPTVRTTYATARHLIKEAGYLELYRGGQMILIRNTVQTPMYFWTMGWLKSKGKPQGMPGPVHDFLTSSIVGGSLSTFFYPLNVLKATAQLTIGGKFPLYRPILSELLQTNGIRRMYKGAHLNFLRSSVGWGVAYVVYQLMSKNLHSYRCPDEKKS